MRVIVPHTPGGLAPETRAAVLDQAPYAEFVELLAGDYEAYWRLWMDLWARREDLVMIEQDIVIHEHVIPQFWLCTKPWCTYGYPYFVGPDYHGSGCVRFSAEIMQAVPNLWELVAGFPPTEQHPSRHWCTLDAYAQITLARRGYEQHRHSPPVGHLHTTPSHGCVALRDGVVTPT